MATVKAAPWLIWGVLPAPAQRRAHGLIELTRRLRAPSTPLPDGPVPALPEAATELRTLYGSFWFDGNDDKLTPWIRRHATWEADLIRLFEANVRAGAAVVDVGANVGFHSVVLSRLVGPSGAVHAFEPLPVTIDILRANLWRHGCDNVTVHEAAATDRVGVAEMAPDAEGRSGARLAHGGITVATTTLDEALDGRAIDILKVDVEGAEPLVLAGARTVLAASPNVLAVVEFRNETHLDGSAPEDVLAGYESLGFRLERLRPDGGTSRASHDELMSAASAAGTLNLVLRR